VPQIPPGAKPKGLDSPDLSNHKLR